MTDAKIIEVLWVIILLEVVIGVHLWHLQQMKIDHLRECIRLNMTQHGTVRVTGEELQAALNANSYRRLRAN